MNNEPLNESERQELTRLREAVQHRSSERTIANAQALASFIWTNHIGGPFGGNQVALWDALPEETQQLIIEFVMVPKKGPKPRSE